MWNFWDRLKKKADQAIPTPPPPVADKPKAKKTNTPKKNKPKKIKEEPVVEIKKFDFDPKDPKVGSIELDWNSSFIDLLRKHGYNAPTEEEIVDLWLNDVCKTIVNNQFQGSTVSPQAMAGTKVVSRKDLGQGKTEVS